MRPSPLDARPSTNSKVNPPGALKRAEEPESTYRDRMAISKGSRGETFLAWVIGGGAAIALLTLTRRSWDACQVDIGKVANGPTLLYVGLPVAVVVNVALFTLVYRLTRGGKGFFSPLLAAAIAITIADLALYSWAGTPASSPGICPGNVPPWWPTWIPT
ncbi:hypothetical protein EV648_103662 [Kribbella sp. VKM Ac-2568]|nr:hypothetical protein EV648_103662 [Kribbella sp. VKM Ac-2568]